MKLTFRWRKKGALEDKAYLTVDGTSDFRKASMTRAFSREEAKRLVFCLQEYINDVGHQEFDIRTVDLP